MSDREEIETASVFSGFVPPERNYFPMPNIWTDIVAEITSLAELKVVEYVLRHTWGFREFGRCKAISINEFCHGRRRSNGSRMDKGTGLSHHSVIDGLRAAVKHGYLICDVDDTDEARVVKSYALKMQPGTPVQNLQSPPSAESSEGECSSFTGGVQNVQGASAESSDRSEKDTRERHQRKTPEKDTACVIPTRPKKPNLTVAPKPKEETHTHQPPAPDFSALATNLTPEGKRVVALYTELRSMPPLLLPNTVTAANLLGSTGQVTRETLELVLESLDQDEWFPRHNVAPNLEWVARRWDTCLAQGKKQRAKKDEGQEKVSDGEKQKDLQQRWITFGKEAEQNRETIRYITDQDFAPEILALFPVSVQNQLRMQREERQACSSSVVVATH